MNSPTAPLEDDRLGIWLNTLGLYIICAALLIAFYYQLVLSELPCPLCLLQRVGMILIGFGFLFNAYFGIRSLHYGVALIGCVIAGIIGVRQVFLHILPGDAGYGSPFLGLHFYSWTVVAAIAGVVAVAIMLMLKKDTATAKNAQLPSLPVKTAAFLFTALIAANLVSTILECGAGQCDDNPTFYQLLGRG